MSTIELRTLRQDAGESCTDERVVLIDGRDHFATLGRSESNTWIGRSPKSTSASDLTVTTEARDIAVACCGCGIEECGVLVALARADDDHVVWEHFRSVSGERSRALDAPAILFDRDQYRAAIAGDAPASAWRPTTRQVALAAHALLRALAAAGDGPKSSDTDWRGDDHVQGIWVEGTRHDAERFIARRSFTVDTSLSIDESAAAVVTAVLASIGVASPDTHRYQFKPR